MDSGHDAYLKKNTHRVLAWFVVCIITCVFIYATVVYIKSNACYTYIGGLKYSGVSANVRS